MPVFQTIESKDNKLIKNILKLAKDKTERLEQQEAVIYGEHLIIEALRFNKLKSIFITDDFLDKYREIIQDNDVNIYLVPNFVLDKINILESSINVVGVIDITSEININNDDDCLVLENIQDPGNLGTILRGANAAGIKQIILSKGSVDLYNPKVLRASQGLQFGLNVFTNIDLDDFINNYSGNLLALTPNGSISIYDCDLLHKTAFVMGNEGNGISLELLHKINTHVKIPMTGNTESLNLAMAATIAIFELSRQRIVG